MKLIKFNTPYSNKPVWVNRDLVVMVKCGYNDEETICIFSPPINTSAAWPALELTVMGSQEEILKRLQE